MYFLSGYTINSVINLIIAQYLRYLSGWAVSEKKIIQMLINMGYSERMASDFTAVYGKAIIFSYSSCHLCPETWSYIVKKAFYIIWHWYVILLHQKTLDNQPLLKWYETSTWWLLKIYILVLLRMKWISIKLWWMCEQTYRCRKFTRWRLHDDWWRTMPNSGHREIKTWKTRVS